jgi:hypothetical protein
MGNNDPRKNLAYFEQILEEIVAESNDDKLTVFSSEEVERQTSGMISAFGAGGGATVVNNTSGQGGPLAVPDATVGNYGKDIHIFPAHSSTSANSVSQIDFKWQKTETTDTQTDLTQRLGEIRATLYNWAQSVANPNGSGPGSPDTKTFPMIAIGGQWTDFSNGGFGTKTSAPSRVGSGASYGSIDAANILMPKIWIDPYFGQISAENIVTPQDPTATGYVPSADGGSFDVIGLGVNTVVVKPLYSGVNTALFNYRTVKNAINGNNTTNFAEGGFEIFNSVGGTSAKRRVLALTGANAFLNLGAGNLTVLTSTSNVTADIRGDLTITSAISLHGNGGTLQLDATGLLSFTGVASGRTHTFALPSGTSVTYNIANSATQFALASSSVPTAAPSSKSNYFWLPYITSASSQNPGHSLANSWLLGNETDDNNKWLRFVSGSLTLASIAASDVSGTLFTMGNGTNTTGSGAVSAGGTATVSLVASPSVTSLTLSASANAITFSHASYQGVGVLVTDVSGNVSKTATLANSYLTNSGITVTAGTNLTGGGSVSLGGSVTLNVSSTPSFTTVATTGTGSNLTGQVQVTAASTASTVALAVRGNSTANADVMTIADSAGSPIVRSKFDKDGNLLLGMGTLGAAHFGLRLANTESGTVTASTAGAGAVIYDGGVLKYSNGSVWSTLASGGAAAPTSAYYLLGRSDESLANGISLGALGTLGSTRSNYMVKVDINASNQATVGYLPPYNSVTPENFLSSANVSTDANLGSVNAVNTTIPSQLAVKTYVDNLSSGLRWKNAVRFASTGAVVIGDLQPGAGPSPASPSIANLDMPGGSTLAAGDRVLLKNQSAQASNGIYLVTASGGVRAADADSASDIWRMVTYTTEGVTNAGTAFVNTNASLPTLDTTSLTFAVFNITNVNITASQGLYYDATSVIIRPDWSAKGDLLIGTGNGTGSIVSAGSNGALLMADSAQTSGTKWQALTVTAGTGLTGGGTFSTTGSLTVNMPNVGSAATYGSASQVPVFTTDAQGRVSAVTNTSIAIGEAAVTWNSKTANTFFAAPDSSNGAPTFRAIVANDVPTLTSSKISDFTSTARSSVSATSPLNYTSSTGVFNLPGLTGWGTDLQSIRKATGTNAFEWYTPTTGTVTSVGLSMPTGFTVANSPVTSTGTLTVTTSLTGLLTGTGSALQGNTIANRGVVFATGTTSVAVDASNFIFDTTNKRVAIGLNATYTAAAISATNARLLVQGTGTTTSSAFMVSDSGGSQRFTILDNGNIGIGANVGSAPDSPLHLRRDATGAIVTFSGIRITSETAATNAYAGEQISPRISLTGTVYDTGAAASRLHSAWLLTRAEKGNPAVGYMMIDGGLSAAAPNELQRLASFGTDRSMRVLMGCPVVFTAVASGGSLTASTAFYYRVTAVDAVGDESASIEVSATTTSPNRTINLSWSAIPGARYYRIYRTSTTQTLNGVLTGNYSSSTRIVELTAASVSYSDTGGQTPSNNQPELVGKASVFRVTNNGDIHLAANNSKLYMYAYDGSYGVYTHTIASTTDTTGIADYTMELPKVGPTSADGTYALVASSGNSTSFKLGWQQLTTGAVTGTLDTFRIPVATGASTVSNSCIFQQNGTSATNYVAVSSTGTNVNSGTRSTGFVMMNFMNADQTFYYQTGAASSSSVTALQKGLAVATYTSGTNPGTILHALPWWNGSSQESAADCTLQVRARSGASTGNRTFQVTDSAGTVVASIDAVGQFRGSSKSFVIPHRDKPGKSLVHGSLEGPEYGVYFRGDEKVDGSGSGRGSVRVTLPSYWAWLADAGYTVHLTPRGPYTVYCAEKDDQGFTVRRTGLFSRWRKIEFDFYVVAARKDIAFELECEN